MLLLGLGTRLGLNLSGFVNTNIFVAKNAIQNGSTCRHKYHFIVVTVIAGDGLPSRKKQKQQQQKVTRNTTGRRNNVSARKLPDLWKKCCCKEEFQ